MKVEAGGREYEIRRFEESDEASLVELHHLVFGEASDLRLVQRDWRFQQNPAGRHRTSVCVSEDGSVVCAYTGIPLRGQLLGQPASFALMVDSMTHPDYRGAVLGRRGLFVRTALHWIDRNTGSGGLDYCFGVPQERVARLGSLLLGYRLWDDFDQYSREIQDTVTKRVRRRFGDRRVTVIDDFGVESDELWKDVQTDYPSAVVRDREYLTWRYRGGAQGDYVALAARSRSGRWGGWIVLRVEDGTATLVDAIVPRDPVLADALLYAAIGASLDRDARIIEGWATGDSLLGGLYARAGMWPSPQVGTHFACDVFAPVDPDAVRATLYVQPGDTDDF